MSGEGRVHVTVGDVAREAGVSVATAARALGDYGSVSAKSRARVEQAAASLGYSPNMVARSMITGSTKTIGVIVADIENQFFQRVLRGITHITSERGYDLVLANTDESLDRERRALRVMTSRRVDGIILSPTEVADTQEIRAVAESGVPIVLIDRRLRGVNVDSVGIRNRGATYDATNRLISLGHKHIAVITGGTAESAPVLKNATVATLRRLSATTLGTRTAGYREALEAAGLAYRSDFVAANGFRQEDARAATVAFFALPDPPTAIIAFDSLLSLGVLQGLRDVGARSPDDVSLIGFDDAPWAEVVDPPLTVIGQPTLEIGVQAATLLLDRLAGRGRARVHHRLETTLIERGSVGLPRLNGVRTGPRAGL